MRCSVGLAFPAAARSGIFPEDSEGADESVLGVPGRRRGVEEAEEDVDTVGLAEDVFGRFDVADVFGEFKGLRSLGRGWGFVSSCGEKVHWKE